MGIHAALPSRSPRQRNMNARQRMMTPVCIVGSKFTETVPRAPRLMDSLPARPRRWRSSGRASKLSTTRIATSPEDHWKSSSRRPTRGWMIICAASTPETRRRLPRRCSIGSCITPSSSRSMVRLSPPRVRRPTAGTRSDKCAPHRKSSHHMNLFLWML
jgi:hypothetical protein